MLIGVFSFNKIKIKYTHLLNRSMEFKLVHKNEKNVIGLLKNVSSSHRIYNL